MERRFFIEKWLFALALGGAFLAGGCGRQEKSLSFGNQEKLWQIATDQAASQQPIELSYAKDTPAIYRDASMGKADPSFVPRIGGG